MKIERIILHHSLTKDSVTVSWGAITNYHINHNGWDDNGYHFGIELINNRYEILVGRMLNIRGAHCRNHNEGSIGICLIGNFNETYIPANQWDLALRLCRSLMDIFFLTPKDVYRDRDFHSRKTCPGKNFNIYEFRRQL